MKLNHLDASKRKELSPFNAHYILCETLCILGTFMKFGWEVPRGMNPQALHHHYSNGVIGTKEELDLLDEPVELTIVSDLAPKAKWITHPNQIQEENKEIEEAGGDIFSMENAGLLKGKNDLIAYAKLFEIKLKKATNINMNSMRETLRKEAIKLGLIKEE